MIIFSIFIKKKTKLIFFFKKLKLVQTDWFRFDFFRIKTGSNRFELVFFGLALFFRFRFGLVFSVSGL